MNNTPDTFHAVCIVASAGQISVARQGAWEFHKQDSPRFNEPAEKMLTVGVSPEGTGSPTHFVCARHDTLQALGRIETYQQALIAVGKPRVGVTIYVSEEPLDMAADLKKQIADHEAATLAKLGLRRIA